MDASDSKAAELAELVRGIRERVLSRYPTEGAGNIRLADLIPAVHARDTAEGKVASIGNVNPRPPGFLNDLAQSFKKLIARSLKWFVRDQVDFNRASLRCIDTLIETQNETNRALADLAQRIDTASKENEQKLLKGISESTARINESAARISAISREFTDRLDAQQQSFSNALGRSNDEIQQRFWKEVEKVMAAQQAMIHQELRLIRQRAVLKSSAPISSTTPVPAPQIDWLLFAQKFRGGEESIKQSFSRYVDHFRGCMDVLDIGCGRGEFLELMRESGIPTRGIDLNTETVALCRNKGLDAEQADMFSYLGGLADGSLGGVFCAQVIEHLQPSSVVQLIRLCSQKLRQGAPILFETPNPECLAIFATHFYIDPTHVRPVPPVLLTFYLEEAGFGTLEVVRFAQAGESMPSISQLPEEFKERFFGALDYAVIANKL